LAHLPIFTPLYGLNQIAVVSRLKEIYGKTLVRLGKEGLIIPWESYDKVGSHIGFGTEQMNDYLPTDKNYPGTWGNGVRYWYWIYPSLLEPTIKLELGSLGQPEEILNKMQQLKDYAGGKSKQILTSCRYNIVKTVATGIRECETEDPTQIDEDAVSQAITVAIKEMLNFQNDFFSR
jgi:hypothetical protein